MRFTKMQGLGNDYLYHYGELEHAGSLAVQYSDRHFGIGADGIITISPSDCADFRMRIFNADGSEAKMCGNGIRCVGKYVYDKGYTNKTELTVETLSGIRTLTLQTKDGRVTGAAVHMGICRADEPISLNTSFGSVVVTPVSVGNPHAVCFLADAEQAPLTTVGRELERHPYFKDGVNVEFVQVMDSRTLRMRVWERGSGVTMACGTGACASATAAAAAGFCEKGTGITVRLDGGELTITVGEDNAVLMTGPAETICECEVNEE